MMKRRGYGATDTGRRCGSGMRSHKVMTDLEPPMLVIDSGTNMFGEPWFQPRLLVTEKRPVRVGRLLGTYGTRQEAQAAGDAALRTYKP